MNQQTPRNQNSDTNNSINRLADAIAGIANRQRPQAATMLKSLSTDTLLFDGKTKKIELFEDFFHTMLKMQPEMTKAMKINHFHAHLRKEALETFRNISESKTKLSMTCELRIDENISNQNHRLKLKTNGINSHSIPIQTHCLTSKKSSTNVLKEHPVTTPKK